LRCHKGKAKDLETEKPKKPRVIPLQIGRAFKIYDPKALDPLVPPATQSAKKSPIKKKKKRVEAPPQVAKVLKLVNEDEGLEAQ
jgi:hypothetical protein